MEWLASKLTYDDDVGSFDSLDLWKGHPETEEIVKTLYQNLVIVYSRSPCN